MGVHRCAQEESAAELRAASGQHPRGARGQVHAEAAVELQPPVGYVVVHSFNIYLTQLIRFSDTNLLYVM